MKDPADKKTMDILTRQERRHMPTEACKELATIVLDKAEKQRAPKPPLEVLVARLRRYEQRMVAIKIECEEYMHKCGEEPSNVTRIYQIVNGEYDT
jgi:hypothetical protein